MTQGSVHLSSMSKVSRIHLWQKPWTAWIILEDSRSLNLAVPVWGEPAVWCGQGAMVGCSQTNAQSTPSNLGGVPSGTRIRWHMDPRTGWRQSSKGSPQPTTWAGWCTKGTGRIAQKEVLSVLHPELNHMPKWLRPWAKQCQGFEHQGPIGEEDKVEPPKLGEEVQQVYDLKCQKKSGH
jgi:hypothetical protein